MTIDAKHAIVQELKRLAAVLGRPPKRNELGDIGSAYSRLSINAVFGTYTEAMKAAGLDPKSEKENKRTKKNELKETIQAVFERPISDIANFQKNLIHVKGKRRGLWVGDTHFPFTCVDTLSLIYARAEQTVREGKPFDFIAQLGDLFDMFSFAKFPRSLNYYRPDHEIELGHKMATEMWATLRKILPNAECFQLRGNHDVRPMKRILECFPEGDIFLNPSVDKLYQFDGVKTIMDPREELFIDNIAAIHGYLGKLGDHRDFNLMNIVCGHSHTGGVVLRNTHWGVIWELNCGYVGNPESKALSYTSQKMTKWTKGWGETDEFGPRFIPA